MRRHCVTVQREPSGEWCIKGKQDIVNGDCTACDFNPWSVVAGLMWALVFAEGVGSQFN